MCRALLLIITLLGAPALFDATCIAQSDDAVAQDRPRRRPGRQRPDAQSRPDKAEDEAKAADDKKDDEDDEEIKNDDTYLAVTGGIVHTVAGPDISGATILCKNGKILEIGRRVHVPEGAEIIDASGMHVYPGLVAVRSTGIIGDGTPSDTTNLFGFNMTLGLAAGITTAVQVNGNGAAKLSFGTLDDHDLRSGLWETLSYSTRNPSARRATRRSLERVRQHLRDVEAYEREKRDDPDAKKPDESWIRGDYAKHMRLLKGEAKAMMRINSAPELIDACELADQFGLDIIVSGGTEAWTVADRVGQAGMSVILMPRDSQTPDEETSRPNGSSIQNASILREHGVRVAVTPAGGLFGPGHQISMGGLAGRDLLHLPMAAAFAARGGLSSRDAIRTITIDAARIIGVDDRVGSIEIGKDADFAITDGDLLHYMTHVHYTVVNGRVAYDKTKDTLFSHIRPAADPDAAPPGDYWPRRLGDDW